MKIRSLILATLTATIVLSSASFEHVNAQQRPTIFKLGFSEKFYDDLEFVNRFPNEIEAIKQKQKDKPKIANLDVLFVGSSSIRGWRSVYEDMSPLKVINNGFGGATIRDILYHYDIVVKPFKAKKIVLYVENDISINGKIELHELFDLFRVFANKVKNDFPDSKLYFVSFKPSPARKNLEYKQIVINELLKGYAQKQENVEYIDIASPMKASYGTDTTLFLNDKLHMNRKGYEIWIKAIKPEMLK